jgi:hypothetical protein
MGESLLNETVFVAMTQHALLTVFGKKHPRKNYPGMNIPQKISRKIPCGIG